MFIEQLNQEIEKRGSRKKTFCYDNYTAFKGKYLTGQLFYERAVLRERDFSKCIYTMDDERNGYISLKSLYLEIADPTEYEFAQICFYSYEHYQKMMEFEYFKKFINTCRDELELKLRCDAVRKIKDEAKEGKGSSAIIASKYIIERGWIQNKKDRHVLKRRFEQDKKIDNILSSDLALISKIDVSQRTN